MAGRVAARLGADGDAELVAAGARDDRARLAVPGDRLRRAGLHAPGDPVGDRARVAGAHEVDADVLRGGPLEQVLHGRAAAPVVVDLARGHPRGQVGRGGDELGRGLAVELGDLDRVDRGLRGLAVGRGDRELAGVGARGDLDVEARGGHVRDAGAHVVGRALAALEEDGLGGLEVLARDPQRGAGGGEVEVVAGRAADDRLEHGRRGEGGAAPVVGQGRGGGRQDGQRDQGGSATTHGAARALGIDVRLRSPDPAPGPARRTRALVPLFGDVDSGLRG